MERLTPKQFGERAFARRNFSLSAYDEAGLSFSYRWRILAGLTFLLFAVALLVFRQTVTEMVSTWYSSRTFSHCFLVFPLSSYLIWRRRKQLAALEPAPDLSGLLIILGLCCMWVLGNLGEIKLVEEFALVGILVGLIWTLLGSATVRVLALPLAFLIFAIPFGLGLIGPLQDVTAWFAVHALTLSRVPAVLENRVLSVPNATWTVAEACSGIRYLFSSVMLGVIYASLTYRTRKRRLLFLCASIIVPILANGIRAYGIVLLAYATNNRLAADVDHIVYGWVFFTIVQLILFVVGLRWRQPSDPENPPAAAQDFHAGKNATPFPSAAAALATFAAIVLLGFAPVLSASLWNRAANHEGLAAWADPPVSVSGPWRATPVYDTSWVPDLRGTNRGFVQSYVSGEDRVDLYWALYSGQRGFELLNSYNRVANPRLWPLVAESSQYETVDGNAIRVQRTLLGSGTISRSLWTWYWVNGEYTGDPAKVKLLQVGARLRGISPPTCVLVIGTNSAGTSPAEAVLRDFLAHATFLPVSRSPESVVRNANDVDLTVHNVSH